MTGSKPINNLLSKVSALSNQLIYNYQAELQRLSVLFGGMSDCDRGGGGHVRVARPG